MHISKDKIKTILATVGMGTVIIGLFLAINIALEHSCAVGEENPDISINLVTCDEGTVDCSLGDFSFTQNTYLVNKGNVNIFPFISMTVKEVDGKEVFNVEDSTLSEDWTYLSKETEDGYTTYYFSHEALAPGVKTLPVFQTIVLQNPNNVTIKWKAQAHQVSLVDDRDHATQLFMKSGNRK